MQPAYLCLSDHFWTGNQYRPTLRASRALPLVNLALLWSHDLRIPPHTIRAIHLPFFLDKV